MIRRLMAGGLALALVACGGSSDQAADAADTAAMAAPVALANFAGTWNLQAMGMDSDSVVTTAQMMGTADASGWMMHLPNREPVPMRVSIAGDSLVAEAGPFESVLRQGVMVSTRTAFVLRDGQLMGPTVARYQTTAADSVVNLRFRGTRAP